MAVNIDDFATRIAEDFYCRRQIKGLSRIFFGPEIDVYKTPLGSLYQCC